MAMRIFHFIIILILGLALVSCRWRRDFLKVRKLEESAQRNAVKPNTIDTSGALNFFSPLNYSFLDFPYEDTMDYKYGVYKYNEGFSDGGERWGIISNGYKQGKWTTGLKHYDSLDHLKSIEIYRLEYFKDGLRDSVFRLYHDNEVVYSTYFRNGTGLLKAFYDNDQLYYEVTTLEGYFGDTLRLYTEQGMLKEKLVFQKDSLVFHRVFTKE